MRPAGFTAALLALMAVAGCAPEPTLSAGPDRRLPGLAGTEWRLQTLAGAPAAAGASIAFESDRIARGNTGCNRFGASYAFAGGQLSFGSVKMTEIACPGPAMAAEAAFIAALRATRRAGTSEVLLVMLDADGAALATLVRR